MGGKSDNCNELPISIIVASPADVVYLGQSFWKVLLLSSQIFLSLVGKAVKIKVFITDLCEVRYNLPENKG